MLPEDTERVMEDGTVVAVTHSTGSSTIPPPWLINMQRYGPPPSYPSLRIPGLNAPLPPGASYGYHYGGWGKPPVDEFGQPLYGDAFGDAQGDDFYGEDATDAAVDKSVRWGALAVEEFADTAEDEADMEGEDELDAGGLETPSTVDGLGSLASGLETPDTIDLRKRAGLETPDSSVQNGAPRELYHVIQERNAATSSGVGQLFGSDRTYLLPGKGDEQYASLDPDQLESAVKTHANADGVVTGISSLGVGAAAINGAESAHLGAGAESEVTDGRGTGKKRKSDAASNAVKRMKEFKF